MGDATEEKLVEERERLRITLASIGDAVISTDAQGRVSFLNGVAERLTGWSQSEALGRPLLEVFHIVNETTRKSVDNPALRALSEGRIVELANHTVLIARDGSERPIDDSAAPMRDGAGRVLGAVLVFRDVTERRRNEEAQARLAAIVTTSDDAILSKSLDGVIRSWNNGAQRIFGYTAEEAVGQHITLIIPPTHVEEERSILDRLRRGERIDHFETIRRTKDGRLLEISLTVSPVKNREGEVIGASKIARDITDQKRAERALRTSESRHRFLGELTTATQQLTDPDQVMSVSARLLAQHLRVDRVAYAEVEGEKTFVITGDFSRTLPSIVGRWPIAAFGAECEAQMLANEPFVIDDVDVGTRAGKDLTAYRQTNIQAVICVPLHKAGKLTAAMAVHQTTPRHWAADELELLTTVVALSWDALDRIRANRATQAAVDRLALAIDAARLGDWSWDVKTDLVTLSVRGAEIFGIPPGPHMTWARIQALLHPEDRAPTAAAVNKAVEERGQYATDYRLRRDDGTEVWVSAKGRAQYEPNGTPIGMYGVVQDITEQKRLERELAQRASELADADRKKDDFIAMLAHELRGPLAPLRNGLQVMRLAAGDVLKVAKARDMMDRQLEHMVRLIDDLLDISRMNRNKLFLQKKQVTLSDVVSHAIEASGPAIDAAGHTLSVSLPSEPVLLDADPVRLAQVFSNLLSNSAKYTEHGGKVSLVAKREGPEVVVTVTDNGIGIPAESLPRIFDMFSQVDRAIEHNTGGLGIGLALVKGLVETHQGSVSAVSPGQGQGSTFTVRLPVAGESAQSNKSPADAAGQKLPKRRRVLVADDNHDGAESIGDVLDLLGNEVQIVHDGAAAVAAAETMKPDLILMDVGMPKLDGLEATRRIRAQSWGKQVTIIALTGWGQEADKQRSRDAGCDGHLVKPIGLPQLETVLASMDLTSR